MMLQCPRLRRPERVGKEFTQAGGDHRRAVAHMRRPWHQAQTR